MTRGASLDSLEGGAERGYLPHALTATALVVVVPALALLPLAPFEGVLDVLLATLLATGASVALASAGSALWTRTRWSRELAFGDLMLWEWALRRRRRRRLEEDLAAVAGADGDSARRLRTLWRMTVMLEARDERSHGHSDRVARHAARIAARIGLAPDEIARLRVAAAVHDVGKTRVPRSQLDAGRDADPRAQAGLAHHADAGAEMVAAAGAPEIAEIVRHQDTRFDGAGDPVAGLTSAPRAARVLAVADAFDSLTEGADAARARANALDALAERAGRELDPQVVAAFVDYYSARRSIAAVAVFATAPLRLTRWLAAAPAGLGASVPPLTQGACVAGALAIAGACLPLPGADRDALERADRPAEQQGQVAAVAGPAGRSGGARGGADGAEGPVPSGSGPQATDETAGGTPQSPGSADPGAGNGRELAGAPAPSTGSTGPSGGSAGVPGLPSLPDLPGRGESPSGPLGQLELPDLPGDPSEVVDPLVDQVEEVLAPLPVDRVTDPVQDLLGRVGDGGKLLP